MTPDEKEFDWLRGMAQLEDEAGGFPGVTGRLPRQWQNVTRVGLLGKRRDGQRMRYDINYGAGNWRIAWITTGFPTGSPAQAYTFAQACKLFYEESYHRYLQDRPDDLDFICEFAECIDNALTNVHSGLDYAKQETDSTHIQDTAIRNVLAKLGRTFTGKRTELLVIRSANSNGARFGPGNVPFYRPEMITQPSKRPLWAQAGSVEDFWQSNKWLQTCTNPRS